MRVERNTLTAEQFLKLYTSVDDWAVSLELITMIEAVPFYEKMRFEPRQNEWDGPGMFNMIR